ncbi:MAG: gliding motility-associated C-terminal domain-containing protein [Flavobacteriales bacterium]|nr:gliding motility-associated C-terminal domain-containing protein [Flavobacteriales bacterium]
MRSRPPSQDAYGCAEFHVSASSPCSFDTEVFIPRSFSPNEDGVNDRFIIPRIEGFPNNTVKIFSRWGAKVFDGAGYDNQAA